MVQYAPAPMIAAPVAAAVGGGVATIARNAGSIANGSAATANAIESAQQKNKRSFKGDSWTKIERPDNGQYGTKLAWQLCGNDLKKATVGFAVPEPGSLQVSGVPPTCMTLSTTLTGKFNEGNPVPLGNDAIKFTNLSKVYFDQVVAALRARPD